MRSGIPEQLLAEDQEWGDPDELERRILALVERYRREFGEEPTMLSVGQVERTTLKRLMADYYGDYRIPGRVLGMAVAYYEWVHSVLEVGTYKRSLRE